jgi:hypothetical protein
MVVMIVVIMNGGDCVSATIVELSSSIGARNVLNSCTNAEIVVLMLTEGGKLYSIVYVRRCFLI